MRTFIVLGMIGLALYDPTVHARTCGQLDEVGSEQRCNQDEISNQQNEITLASWRLNTDILLAGANDYRLGEAPAAGFYRSLDGGATWVDALVTRGPAGRFDRGNDPVACIDNEGRMYACYIVAEFDSLLNGIYVQTSLDSGTTWSDPVGVAEVLGGYPRPLEDKPMAAVDVSFDSPYQGNLYVTWTHTSASAVIHFSRSSDGGQSFSDPLQISTSASTHMSCPATGPNGEVYAVWFENPTETIRFDRSLDAGVTWGPDIEVASFATTLNQEKPCGRYSTPSYPVVSCDLSTGPRRGWIYVCWANWNGHDSDILMCRSEDGGSTWSTPARVNDDATNTWQWWPWISVHPGTGTLGCSWLDCREDPQGCLYRSWGTISYDGGETWIENMPIASEQSDPADIRFLGDYCGLTFRDGGFYAGWVDTRDDDGDCYVAWFRDDGIKLVVSCVDQGIRLDWTPGAGGPFYLRYADAPDGPFHTILASTHDTSFVDEGALSITSMRFYQVSRTLSQ